MRGFMDERADGSAVINLLQMWEIRDHQRKVKQELLNNINEVNMNTDNVERYDLIGVAIKDTNPVGNHVSYASYKALQDKLIATEQELNRQLSNCNTSKEHYRKSADDTWRCLQDKVVSYNKLETKYDAVLFILCSEVVLGAIYLIATYFKG